MPLSCVVTLHVICTSLLETLTRSIGLCFTAAAAAAASSADDDFSITASICHSKIAFILLLFRYDHIDLLWCYFIGAQQCLRMVLSMSVFNEHTVVNPLIVMLLITYGGPAAAVR